MEESPSNNGTPKEEAEIRRPGNNIKDLDVRSAEVQQIIGRPPHWLVRYGIGGLLGVLMLILLTASVIKYPEVVRAPVRLTAINAPKTLQSRINGKLVKLSVKNETEVQKNQVLGWMQSTASHKQVLALSEKIDSMHHWLADNQAQKIKAVALNRFSDLGNLQKDFQQFEQQYQNFLSFLPGSYYSHKQQMLKRELKYKRQLLQQLKSKKQIQQKQYKLAHRQFRMKKKLKQQNFIAPMKFSKQQSQLLGRRLPLQQTEAAIISNHAEQINKKSQLLELHKKMTQQREAFLQSLNTLQSAIDRWKKKYLLVAPFKGKVIYAGIIQKNQNFKAGQQIFYIKPDNAHFFGELLISQHSFGKIQKGQKVLVRFSGYPYRAFGSVPGKISYVSEIPVKDSAYVAKVRFPDGLSTDYGKTIPPEDGMMGHAKIITNNMRLLERLFSHITNNLQH